MSFQSSSIQSSFGVSGELIFSFSIKGQLIEDSSDQIFTLLYTFQESNQTFSFYIYSSSLNQSILISNNYKQKPVIQSLQFDIKNKNVWFGGYFDSPLISFYGSYNLSNITLSDTTKSFLITTDPNYKSINYIFLVNATTIIYSAISQNEECFILSNISNGDKRYQFESGSSIKEIFRKNKLYHIIIEKQDPITKNIMIQVYKIPENNLTV
jgi:hypothetical protein